MQTFRRIAAVLTFPAIAYLGAACERMEMPTEARPSALVIADPAFVVDDDHLDCPSAPYTSIQAAVNAAPMSGAIITVCPGTYTENVFLAKSVTLRGAQWGVDARGRSASEATVIPLNPLIRTLELRTGSVGSIIDGFTFLGGTRAIESTTGPLDRLQILNNRILGFTGNGVFLNDNGINITVNQNDIDGTTKTGSGALFHLDQDNFDGLWFTNNRVVNGQGTPAGVGTGFFVDGTRNVDKSTAGARTPEFSGNFINNNGTGVNLGRLAWGDGPISGNTFSNNFFDGLQGGPKKAAISQNTFDGNGRNGLTLTSFGNTTDPARGAQNNTVTQNCFTRNGFAQAGAGIFFSATQFPGTISSNVAHQNNITGNAMGARYPVPGTETIDAELNWWGAANGPGLPDGSGSGDGVDGHGKIDFTPYRTTPAAGTPCSAGPPATLTLTPAAATNPVETQHCVTATVEDAMGRPVPDVTVQFTVTGSVNTSGSAVTDANGQATFCYMGPELPGADVIRAFADANNNTTEDAGEPFGVAAKAWVLPVTTPLCEITITNGGWITALNGDRGSFGGNAKSSETGDTQGQEEYQDHGPAQPLNVHSINVLAIVCDGPGEEASIYGQATIDGAGSFFYRIKVRDLAESGRGQDTYWILLGTGYTSGDRTLEGGNVQIRKQ
jgi:hypothetical protein